MKYAELKNRFKNKYAIRVMAGVLSVALLGTCVGVYQVNAGKTDGTETVAEADTETDAEGELKDAIKNAVKTASEDKVVGKDETVYLIANANGDVNKTIVSDWLKNGDKKDTLEDTSDLENIENVKGDETFDKDGNKLTWKADGADIYYQGTTKKEAPVSEKITYYLDGEEISPEELAGKSGKVTIRFDYTNNEKTTRKVNGKSYEVYVPFTVVSGMVLNDNFTNVNVTNGKVISDGKNNVVVGMAMPGLKESLDVDEKDFDEDVNFPDYVEVTADVEDFSLDMTVTLVTSELLSSMNLDGSMDLSALDEIIDEMTDASSKLVKGSSDLSDGVNTLQDGIKSYTDGATTLADNLAKLENGTSTLNSQIPTLTKGISDLKDGSGAAYSAIGTIDAGAAQLETATGQLKAGGSTLAEKTTEAADGASRLNAGAAQLVAGYEGTDKQTGAAEGAKQLDAGVSQLCNGLTTMLTTVETSKAQANAAASQIYADDNALKADAAATIGGAVTQNVTALTQAVGTYMATGQFLFDMNSTLAKNSGGAVPMYIVMDAKNTSAPYKFAGDTQQDQAANAQALAATLRAQATALGADYSAKVAEFTAAAQNVQTCTDALNQAVTDSVTTVVTKATGYAGQKGAATALDQVTSGVAQAGLTSEKLQQLSDGASALNKGINGYTDAKGNKVTGLAEGTKTLAKGTDSLSKGLNGYEKNGKHMDGLKDATGTLKSSLSTLNDSVAGYDKEDGTHVTGLAEGTSQLKTGLGKLDAGITTLNDGAPALAGGVTELNSGASQLNAGAKTLVSNNSKLISGVGDLFEGSVELKDGMKEFDEKAIQKLADTYHGDVQSLLDRLEAVVAAGEDYTTFTQVADGVNGSVKFILKTDAVKADEEK